jgi:Transcriptional regulator, Out at first
MLILATYHHHHRCRHLIIQTLRHWPNFCVNRWGGFVCAHRENAETRTNNLWGEMNGWTFWKGWGKEEGLGKREVSQCWMDGWAALQEYTRFDYSVEFHWNWIFIGFFVCLQGGEVVQETITSNISDDVITLEFQRSDGTLITELIDFRNVSINTFSFVWSWETLPQVRLCVPRKHNS